WRAQVRKILQAYPEGQVNETCDGREAVQNAQLHPDIVLLDIGMPILNGLEAAKKIREDTPTSKLIFLTTNSDGDLKTTSLATRAEAYLLKGKRHNRGCAGRTPNESSLAL